MSVAKGGSISAVYRVLWSIPCRNCLRKLTFRPHNVSNETVSILRGVWERNSTDPVIREECDQS